MAKAANKWEINMFHWFRFSAVTNTLLKKSIQKKKQYINNVCVKSQSHLQTFTPRIQSVFAI